MKLSILGARSELGRLLAAEASVAGWETPRTGPVDVAIDVGLQGPNSLLHDGNAWKGYRDHAIARTRRALEQAQARHAKEFVFASYSFLRASSGTKLEPPLGDVIETALAVEGLVLEAPIPARVVRLGYLYGPRMKDLRAYRLAFRLGRPYWSGSRKALQDNLHQYDACTALLAAAATRSRTRLHYATDGHPVAFVRLMDQFARMVGNPLPLHMGGPLKLTARLIIRPEHMQAVKLGMPAAAPSPMVPGWKPRFQDYRHGMWQVVSAWTGRKEV